MFAIELGSTLRAWLLAWAYVIVAVVFGMVWLRTDDGFAALLCCAGLIGVLRMGWLLSRRYANHARASTVVTGRAGAATPDERLFVSLARQSLGVWSRSGVVVLTPTYSGFVPISGWAHLAWLAGVVIFSAEFRFVDLALGMPDPGDLDAALDELVRQRNGFTLDETWSYTPSQRWLSRSQSDGIVRFEHLPPAHLLRWPTTTPLSADAFARIRDRLVAGTSLVVALLGVGGLAAWRWSGDSEYFLGAMGYVLLIIVAVLAALVRAKRGVVTDTRP